jgi:CubicO group peptidase (beta-lactamase class C family)
MMRNMSRIVVFLLVPSLLLLPIVGSGAPPDSVRIDRAAVASLITELRADERRDLNGVFVSIDGATALEEYFNGEGPDTLHDMRSAGKSITSLAVGIAIDRKLIRGVDVPLTTLLPEPAAPDKAQIKLEDVLTMRSGLDADDEVAESAGNEDKMDQAPDWLTFALKVPMKDTPGRTYTYSSVNAFLAGAVVERASGGPMDVFATKYLFEPLGITKTEWRRGPNNRTAGQGNLRMRLRDMARIGEMVLNEGEIRENGENGEKSKNGTRRGMRRVISRAWIQRSLTGITPIAARDPYADAYGYMWYLKQHKVGARDVAVHFASGNGGNKIYVIPSLRMVVAITSSAYGRGYGQRRSQEILLRILAAATAAATPAPGAAAAPAD